MYAKLENGKLTYAPKNYKTTTHLIINFNNNEDLMEKYGFKEVIDIKPTYDSTTQYLYVDGYTEDENTIIINYMVNEIEVSQEPTLEDRVLELERVVGEQREFIERYKLLDLLNKKEVARNSGL